MGARQAGVCSAAAVMTPQAARYLTQLGKHFEHMVPVTLGERSGHIAFPCGDCRLVATDGTLTLSLQAADDGQLCKLQDVVARHLLRFAFREELHIEWHCA